LITPGNYEERYQPLYGIDETVTPAIPQRGLLGWTGSAWEKIESSSGNLVTNIGQVTGNISTNNSTTTVLDPGGVNVFTGTADEVTNYKSIGINVIASHTSAADGMQFQFSSDGTNWDKVHSFTVPATTAKFFNMPVEARYFRIVYTNSGTLQTYFRLQVIYHATVTKESTLRLGTAIDAETAAQLGRSVITCLDVGSGLYKNISSYNTGTANALIQIAADAFGNTVIYPNLTFAASGASALTILPSAGATSKNRIFNMTITASAAGTLTISDGFGAVYAGATVPYVLNFGVIGRLQTTVNTAITITNSGGGNVSAHGAYKTE
jgi:hypothetical protein